MITFKQFITEEASDLTSFLTIRCSDLVSKVGLEEAIETPLLRGIKSTASAKELKVTHNGKELTGFILIRRKDRRPLDTALSVSKAADEIFKEKINWKPRSEGVFCLGSKSSFGHNYGKIHAIFPTGNFKFAWSPSIDDFTSYVTGLFHTPASEIKDYQIPDFISTFKKDFDYKTTDLKSAIASGSEIMLDCDQYLAIDYEDLKASEANNDLKVEIGYRDRKTDSFPIKWGDEKIGEMHDELDDHHNAVGWYAEIEVHGTKIKLSAKNRYELEEKLNRKLARIKK